MDRGARRAIVQRIAESDMSERLSTQARKNCSRENHLFSSSTFLPYLGSNVLSHLSLGPNEIYFLCFIENIQIFS